MKVRKEDKIFHKGKGMAINISVLLIIVLVMLILMFLLAGVFKDFVFKQRGLFGLTPGTETLQITDSDTSKKVTIECRIISGNPPNEYKYNIIVDMLGLSYPSKATVYPVFVYKGLTATSLPQEVVLPDRLSFDSLPLRYKPEASNKELTELANNQSIEGIESVVIAFFKRDDDCIGIAASSDKDRLQKFIDKCAKTLETETSVAAMRRACV